MTLRISTSTVFDGTMKPQSPEMTGEVRRNRSRFFQKNHIKPLDATLVNLVYEGTDYTRYQVVTEHDKGDGIVHASTIVCDGLVTTTPHHALFLPLADCIGAVIHDTKQNILMVSHLGRHNLEQSGGTKSIEYLKNRCNTDPDTISVWLSPAAGKTNYPLYRFDRRSLHEVATEQLIAAGVTRANIETSPIDTTQNREYFSHSQFLNGSRETDGRFAVVAVLT